MEGIIFKFFEGLFRFVLLLVAAGVFSSALMSIIHLAYYQKRSGLVGMLHVNQQLVGKTK